MPRNVFAEHYFNYLFRGGGEGERSELGEGFLEAFLGGGGEGECSDSLSDAHLTLLGSLISFFIGLWLGSLIRNKK